jgi:hypothetical protein
MKKLLIGLGLTLTCSFANAGLITYNDYTLNEDTNIVSGGGLEWLQWDVTVDMTINQALADIADGVINGVSYGSGWVLATNVQMAGLFNDFVLGATAPWDANENTGQESENYNGATVEDINTDPELQMVELFGRTAEREQYYTKEVDFTGALFGSDLDGDNLYNIATVFDDFVVKGYYPVFASAGYSNLFGDNYSADYLRSVNGATGIGVAFVRAPQSVTEVAEPSAMVLMALGVFGLMMRRRNTI